MITNTARTNTSHNNTAHNKKGWASAHPFLFDCNVRPD